MSRTIAVRGDLSLAQATLTWRAGADSSRVRIAVAGKMATLEQFGAETERVVDNIADDPRKATRSTILTRCPRSNGLRTVRKALIMNGVAAHSTSGRCSQALAS